MKYGTKKIETKNEAGETLTAEIQVISEATHAELVEKFGAEKVGAWALSQHTTNLMNDARVDLREGGKRAAAAAARAAGEAEIVAKISAGELTPLEAADAFRKLYAAK